MFGSKVSLMGFGKRLMNEISEDRVSNGAGSLAFFILLALFPAMIALLSVLPYLPIANLQQAVMDLAGQALPAEASTLLQSTLDNVMAQRSGGLLSFGLIAAIWAASSGVATVMDLLNVTYDVKEERGMIKKRLTAIGLTLALGLLIISAFALIVLGGQLQGWLGSNFGFSSALLTFFAALRWVIIALALVFAFEITYYFGPNVEQKFKFVSIGSVFATVVMALATLAFKFYVSNFADYSAMYGSIGAIIILMLWLYIGGLVLLVGSEVNALIEHYSAEGKDKGEKKLRSYRDRHHDRRPEPLPH